MVRFALRYIERLATASRGSPLAPSRRARYRGKSGRAETGRGASGPRRRTPRLLWGVLSMNLTRRCKSSGEAGRSDPERTARRRTGASRPSREAGAERSGERNRESTNRNRIRGAAKQGERAPYREALATKARRRRSGDDAGNASVLTSGDLALCLKGRRAPSDDAEREVSRGRSTVGEAGRGGNAPERPETFSDGKDRTDGRVNRP